MKFWAALFFLGSVVGSVSALALVSAIRSFLRGEYLTAITLLGVAVFGVGMLIPSVIAKAGKVAFRGEHSDAGTIVRQDRKIDTVYQVAALAQFVAMGVYAIFTPMGKVKIPVPQGMSPYFLIISAVGALWAVPSLWAVATHGGLSYLRLTSDGFEVWQGLRTVRGRWDEVRDITASPLRGPLPARGTIFMVTSAGHSRSIVADSYTPGGHALRTWVRFYWAHPEHRDELTDGRALDRLRNLG